MHIYSHNQISVSLYPIVPQENFVVKAPTSGENSLAKFMQTASYSISNRSAAEIDEAKHDILNLENSINYLVLQNLDSAAVATLANLISKNKTPIHALVLYKMPCQAVDALLPFFSDESKSPITKLALFENEAATVHRLTQIPSIWNNFQTLILSTLAKEEIKKIPTTQPNLKQIILDNLESEAIEKLGSILHDLNNNITEISIGPLLSIEAFQKVLQLLRDSKVKKLKFECLNDELSHELKLFLSNPPVPIEQFAFDGLPEESINTVEDLLLSSKSQVTKLALANLETAAAKKISEILDHPCCKISELMLSQISYSSLGALKTAIASLEVLYLHNLPKYLVKEAMLDFKTYEKIRGLILSAMEEETVREALNDLAIIQQGRLQNIHLTVIDTPLSPSLTEAIENYNRAPMQPANPQMKRARGEETLDPEENLAKRRRRRHSRKARASDLNPMDCAQSHYIWQEILKNLESGNEREAYKLLKSPFHPFMQNIELQEGLKQILCYRKRGRFLSRDSEYLEKAFATARPGYLFDQIQQILNNEKEMSADLEILLNGEGAFAAAYLSVESFDEGLYLHKQISSTRGDEGPQDWHYIPENYPHWYKILVIRAITRTKGEKDALHFAFSQGAHCKVGHIAAAVGDLKFSINSEKAINFLVTFKKFNGSMRYNASRLLSEVYFEMGNYDLAIKILEEHPDLKQSTFAQTMQEKIESKSYQYNFIN